MFLINYLWFSMGNFYNPRKTDCKIKDFLLITQIFPLNVNFSHPVPITPTFYLIAYLKLIL